MLRDWPAIILLLIGVNISVSSAGPPGTEFLSANGRYSVELSRTPDNRVLISVFKSSKEGKILDWSRAVNLEENYRGWGPGVYEAKPFITNDGNTVLLRDESAPDLKRDIRIHARAAGQ